MTLAPETRRSRLASILAVAMVCVVAIGGVIWQREFTNYHLATVQPGVLYRDGARSERELRRAVEKVHARTVVCLVDDQEMDDAAKPQFRAEFSYLQAQGIHSERVPVRLGGYPTSDDVQKFLAIASDPRNQPVLVHCAQGVRRTAMMVAAFQESVLGYDKQHAKEAILPFGHSENTVNDIRRFIDGYDPAARTVAGDVK